MQEKGIKQSSITPHLDLEDVIPKVDVTLKIVDLKMESHL